MKLFFVNFWGFFSVEKYWNSRKQRLTTVLAKATRYCMKVVVTLVGRSHPLRWLLFDFFKPPSWKLDFLEIRRKLKMSSQLYLCLSSVEDNSNKLSRKRRYWKKCAKTCESRHLYVSYWLPVKKLFFNFHIVIAFHTKLWKLKKWYTYLKTMRSKVSMFLPLFIS